jgi:tripartite-type tricarboxylate transporter receptor subunit TctC
LHRRTEGAGPHRLFVVGQPHRQFFPCCSAFLQWMFSLTPIVFIENQRCFKASLVRPGFSVHDRWRTLRESMMRRTGILAAGGIAALASLTTPALAQYPSKPITVIVPFAAGGPTDVVARLVGEHMGRTLGTTFVVENVGGAGGSIGMTRAALAQPDGYTIAVGNMGTQSAAPALYPNLKYDPAKSFAQIGVVNYTPQAVVSKKALATTTLKDFIAYVKGKGTTISYGHAGVGSISHVAGLVFNAQFGLTPNMIPYRGTGPVLTDLVAGQIDYTVDQSLNVIPQIKAGTIRVYAIAAPQRLSSLPDVPTTKEAGEDFIFSAWNAMVAPKDVPKEVVDKLSAALSKALDDPTVKERYGELGSSAPQGAERGPAGLQKLVESEVARITPVIKAANVKVE